MIFPITEKNIDNNMKFIMKKAKQESYDKCPEMLDYYIYNYILLRILYIHYLSEDVNDTYNLINQFLRKILSAEGLGKCKITIKYLMNQKKLDNHKIHTNLYSIMNQEIILI